MRGVSMRVAMVSMNAGPLARPGTGSGVGQAVHVRALSGALATAGHEVTIVTRRDGPDVAETVRLRDGVVLRHVTAGPPAALPVDRLVAQVPQFAAELERMWRSEPPDVV